VAVGTLTSEWLTAASEWLLRPSYQSGCWDSHVRVAYSSFRVTAGTLIWEWLLGRSCQSGLQQLQSDCWDPHIRVDVGTLMPEWLTAVSEWLLESSKNNHGSLQSSSSSSSGPGAYAPEHMPQKHRSLWANCATLVPPPSVILDVPTSAARRLHVHTKREILAAKGGTVRENAGREFCLKCDFQVTFRDLLHAANLRHGTDGFTSPPKKGVLRIFFALKNPDSFGRVWTRELGYLKGACYPKTTEAALTILLT